MSAQKFRQMREIREPKALRAIHNLANLSRYKHDEGEAKALVNALLDEVDQVDSAFARKWGWDDTAPADGGDEAEGGATFYAEAAWAHDAITRGDYALAKARLRRVLMTRGKRDA